MPTEPRSHRFSLRRHRLLGADFRRVYAEGSRARGAFLTVVLATNELKRPRLGLSVGKRCWKGAVQRNRVRRVFREAFRLSRDELPTGVDLVMVASTPRLVPELHAIREELVRLARKAARRHEEKRDRPDRSGGAGAGGP